MRKSTLADVISPPVFCHLRKSGGAPPGIRYALPVHRNRVSSLTLMLMLASSLNAAEPTAADDKDWTLASNTAGIALYSRVRQGSPIKEFKAVGSIEATTTSVHQVLDDVDSYPAFMPFVTECRVVKRDGNATFTYQRLSPKLCSDRDYTLRIDEKSWAHPGGPAYLNKWQPANDFGPAQKKGVLRVSLCEGSWLLEPDGEKKTRAVYTIFTDSGGTLPGFLANAASGIGIRKVFAAVRKQVTLPKYATLSAR